MNYLDSLPEPERIRVVAMDMHETFRQAVQMCLPQAKVVVDKFHLIRHINSILDKVRSRLQGGNRRGESRGSAGVVKGDDDQQLHS